MRSRTAMRLPRHVLHDAMPASRHSSQLSVSRRHFLGATGSLAALAAFPRRPAVAADLGRAKTISIFHSTDLHGRILPTSTYEGLDDVGGFARVATCLRRWRRECPDSLTVDVGDVVQGTAASLHSGGRLMIDLFNRLGYDAWTLGNHDFDWGPEKTEALLADSACPVLTANLERGGSAARRLRRRLGEGEALDDPRGGGLSDRPGRPDHARACPTGCPLRRSAAWPRSIRPRRWPRLSRGSGREGGRRGGHRPHGLAVQRRLRQPRPRRCSGTSRGSTSTWPATPIRTSRLG